MNITATVNYHIKSETPQAFEFDVDGIIGKLKSPELVSTLVNVQDLREGKHRTHFNQHGIEFVNSPSSIEHFSLDKSWEATYNEELRDLLAKQIGAKDILVFDHTVRIDDPNANRRPARNVHNDFSEQGARQRLIDLLGEDSAQEFLQGHYAFVNVWRPIEQPIKSSPLGFIHPETVANDDWMNIELIYPDRQGQILGLAANEEHEWFYLSSMTPNEVAIFNIYDNQDRPHLAHSALDITTSDSDASAPRKSIESRTLVRYR